MHAHTLHTILSLLTFFASVSAVNIASCHRGQVQCTSPRETTVATCPFNSRFHTIQDFICQRCSVASGTVDRAVRCDSVALYEEGEYKATGLPKFWLQAAVFDSLGNTSLPFAGETKYFTEHGAISNVFVGKTEGIDRDIARKFLQPLPNNLTFSRILVAPCFQVDLTGITADGDVKMLTVKGPTNGPKFLDNDAFWLQSGLMSAIITPIACKPM